MSEIEIVEDIFGFYPDPTQPAIVKRFTLTNKSGFSAQVINYGARLTSLKVPDSKGQLDDIVWGFDEIEGYYGSISSGLPNRNFGATIGRTANRIANGRFTLDGTEYQLSLNNGPNHLHGGVIGYDKKLWESSVNNSRVTFSYFSKHGEEGYPGAVVAQVTYEITSDNQLIIQYNAIADRSTPVSFTNHTYFNLSGHMNADKKLIGHSIMINASDYTPVDENLIITGEIRSVDETIYDLRTSKDLYNLLQQFPAGPNGFDNNFCITQNPLESLSFGARVEENVSGRVVEVFSDQPGLQFYTANSISETDPIVGKNGAAYFKHGGFCLETQNYPDAVNHANFPSPFLRPGSMHQHNVVYKFTVK